MADLYNTDDLTVLRHRVKTAENTLEEAKKKLLEAENKPKPSTKLPKGFKFWFNSRRNDPLFPGYWVLELEDESGKNVYEEHFDEDRYTWAKAYELALKKADFLVKVAKALVFHGVIERNDPN